MVIYINKLKVKLEYSFLLIIAFAYLVNNRHVLDLIIFSSIHEAAHLVTLCIFRGKAKEIRIAFYGIGLKYDYNFSSIKELVFLLSGAAVNLLLYLLNVGREINLSLALINLIPIYPLDGGRALKLILNKMLSLDISDKIFKFFTALTVIGLTVSSIFSKNVSLILIAVYTIIYAINNSFD